MARPRIPVEDPRNPKPSHRENFSGPAAFAMILTALLVAVLFIGILVSGQIPG